MLLKKYLHNIGYLLQFSGYEFVNGIFKRRKGRRLTMATASRVRTTLDTTLRVYSPTALRVSQITSSF